MELVEIGFHVVARSVGYRVNDARKDTFDRNKDKPEHDNDKDCLYDYLYDLVPFFLQSSLLLHVYSFGDLKRRRRGGETALGSLFEVDVHHSAHTAHG